MNFSLDFNYYSELGVNANSSNEEIANVYRQLVKIYHPDTGVLKSDEKFKRITESYSILKDREKRNEYDRWLRDREKDREKGNYNPNPPINTYDDMYQRNEEEKRLLIERLKIFTPVLDEIGEGLLGIKVGKLIRASFGIEDKFKRANPKANPQRRKRQSNATKAK